MINETPNEVIFRDIHYLKTMITIVLAMGVLLTVFFSVFWVVRITRPLIQVIGAMRSMEKGNLGLTLQEAGGNRSEIGVLTAQFNQMSQSIAQLIRQNDEMQEMKRGMEIQILKSQINPHFLYNTLTTIKWMAVMAGADNIVDSITTLADLLQPIFKDTSTFWTVEKEIDYIRNYVKIMNCRFGGSLGLWVEIPDTMYARMIPKFLLQPLIENAITHGFAERQEGEIRIYALEEEGRLLLKVRDNGTGLAPEVLRDLQAGLAVADSSGRVGLSNIHQRIQLHYGSEYGLELDGTANGGFTATAVLPTDSVCFS